MLFEVLMIGDILINCDLEDNRQTILSVALQIPNSNFYLEKLEALN